MIEGYSVDEAASVLGVPKGRVWELLARGILAGTPEDGGGMRVYLQGRPMEPIVGKPPQSRQADSEERPAGANGNGGEHGQPGFEASPFRELLTEFRNLTERYGQALLALGEARGEVASLRTRVELLEARVDLRLPSSAPFVQWAPPQPGPEPEESEPIPDAADATAAVAPETIEAEPERPEVVAEGPPVPEAARPPAAPRAPKRSTPRPRRRRQGARSATKEFVDALARAQDPTVSPLPGGDEAQTAFNELRERIRREGLVAEAPESTDAAEAIEAERADSIGLGEAAPAEAVELDPLLADEELGGAIQEAAITPLEPVAAEESQLSSVAEPSDRAEAVAGVDQIEPTEPVADEQPVEPAEPVAHEQPGEPAEPVALEQPVEPAELVADAPQAEPETRAEAIEAAEPAVAAYSHEWDEPDWIAEEDIDWGTEQTQTQLEPVAIGETPEIGWDELPLAEGETREEPEAQPPEAEEATRQDAEGQPLPGEEESREEPAPLEADIETQPESEPLAAEEESREEPVTGEAVIESQPEPLAAEEETREEPAPLEAEVEIRAKAEAGPLDVEMETKAESESLAVEDDTREESPPPEGQEDGAESELLGPGPDAESTRPRVLGTATPHAIEVEAPRSATGLGGTVPEPPSRARNEPQAQGSGQPTAPEEELMWLGDEFRAGPAAWSTPGRATTLPKPAAPNASVSAAEDEALARLAVERGWDDEELHAIRSLLAQPGRAVLDEGESEAVTAQVANDPVQGDQTPDEEALDWEQGPSAWNPPPLARESRDLPGAVELDQAMAAFEVSAWSKEISPHADEPDEPRRTEPDQPHAASQGSEPQPAMAQEAPSAPTPQAPSAPARRFTPTREEAIESPSTARKEPEPRRPSVAPPEPRQEADANWLRGRRGPAADAYRRLRRLFP